MALTFRNRWHEKRKNQRVPVEFPSDLALLSKRKLFSSLKPQFHGVVKEASFRGLQFLSEESFPNEEKVQLWVYVRGNKRKNVLKVRGKVSWSKPAEEEGYFLAGVSFDDSRKRIMDSWTIYMAKLIRKVDVQSPQ